MKNWKKDVTWVVAVAVVAAAVYVMALRLGLADGLDFGAGAYYWADIPEAEKIFRDGVYSPSLPYWVYVVLFLAWGWLMYRLWGWVEKKNK